MRSPNTSRPTPSSALRSSPLLVAAAIVALVATNAAATTLCLNPAGTGGCFADVQTAVDAGSPKHPKTKSFNCHPTDQRGAARNCDIGAYES
ncbi:MAG: choice-of-anchor Q domain-containing protein [Candidatus Binatia bacterium]|nr:choice-of-anchor Q domain-containing protein [Candidatus Binatia bacterium]